MLLWREIKARLWLLHGRKYKDKKVFGVALSNYLARLEGRFLKHEGDYWGTLKSSQPGTETQNSKEKALKPSRLNLFEYRKWKRQYEDKRLDEQIRELQCERKIFHEKFEIYKKLPFEKQNDPLPVDQEWEIRQKWRKRYGLD